MLTDEFFSKAVSHICHCNALCAIDNARSIMPLSNLKKFMSALSFSIEIADQILLLINRQYIEKSCTKERQIQLEKNTCLGLKICFSLLKIDRRAVRLKGLHES